MLLKYKALAFCVTLILTLTAISETAHGQPGNANSQGQVEELPPPAGVQATPQPQTTPQTTTPQSTPRMGVTLGPSTGSGVLITDVVPGSPAYNSGLRRGDYIISVGDTKVSNPNSVAAVVAQAVQNDRVALVIWRDARAQNWVVDLRNTGPVAGVQTPQPRQTTNTYANNRYYQNQSRYGSQYRTDPFGYYGRGPRDYYAAPGRRRAINGLYGALPYYYGNGIYLNGGGRGGVRGGIRIGGFGFSW